MREPVLAVRVLGEHLALYRSESGEMGLVAERCPHRGASLAYGIPEEDGLRCPYHGWKFSGEGRCLEQPAEPDGSTFKYRVQIPAYPVQAMGGLVWAYLGPEPAPLLPRYDLFVRDDLDREIGMTRLPCNWLQIMENSMDPVHLEYLHGMLTNYTLKNTGQAAGRESPPPRKDPLRRLRVRDQQDAPARRRLRGQRRLAGRPSDPVPEHPGRRRPSRPRVPDPRADRRYPHLCGLVLDAAAHAGCPRQSPHDINVSENPYTHEDGRLVVETVNGQDMMAWVTQGDISDRTTERLGTSDQGVILYRNLLEENMRKVERGEDPMAVFRDPVEERPYDRDPARAASASSPLATSWTATPTRYRPSSAACKTLQSAWLLVRVWSSAERVSSGSASPRRSARRRPGHRPRPAASVLGALAGFRAAGR